jgi:hypothetical protein
VGVADLVGAASVLVSSSVLQALTDRARRQVRSEAGERRAPEEGA